MHQHSLIGKLLMVLQTTGCNCVNLIVIDNRFNKIRNNGNSVSSVTARLME